MTEILTCELCRFESHDVSVGLVEWRKPINGKKYDAVPRCLDRKACRERALAKVKR